MDEDKLPEANYAQPEVSEALMKFVGSLNPRQAGDGGSRSPAGSAYLGGSEVPGQTPRTSRASRSLWAGDQAE